TTAWNRCNGASTYHPGGGAICTPAPPTTGKGSTPGPSPCRRCRYWCATARPSPRSRCHHRPGAPTTCSMHRGPCGPSAGPAPVPWSPSTARGSRPHSAPSDPSPTPRRTALMNDATTLIGGDWARLAERREVHAPATGEVIGAVCWGTTEDARRAADAAGDAAPAWGRTTGRTRADLLLRAADILADRAPEIARTLAAEAGKRLPEAQGELAFSVEYLRWFAEEARRPVGSYHAEEDPGRRQLTSRTQAGVVVRLTTWNYPCSM